MDDKAFHVEREPGEDRHEQTDRRAVARPGRWDTDRRDLAWVGVGIVLFLLVSKVAAEVLS